MTAIGDAVAAEALEWCGTPFRWQASAKGAGADCKGLIAGVARELGLPEAATIYAGMADYPRGAVDHRLLLEGLAEVFDRVPPGAELEPGDVLALELMGVPQHLAIKGFGDRAIVARAPSAKVRETSLAALLRAMRLNSAWRWKDRELSNV